MAESRIDESLGKSNHQFSDTWFGCCILVMVEVNCVYAIAFVYPKIGSLYFPNKSSPSSVLTLS